FRVRMKETLLDGVDALHCLLRAEYGLEPEAAAELAAFFLAQETVSEIPSHGLVVEASRLGCGDGWMYSLHVPLDLPANAALARVLAKRLSATRHIRSFGACLGCALVLPPEMELDEGGIRELLAPVDWKRDLEQAMAQSLSLQRHFHHAAETGLL